MEGDVNMIISINIMNCLNMKEKNKTDLAIGITEKE